MRSVFKGAWSFYFMNINELIFRSGKNVLINTHVSLVSKTIKYQALGRLRKFSSCAEKEIVFYKMAPSVFTRIVASAVSIADRSGEIIRDVMKAGVLNIVDKGTNDLQTEADRRVQRCIIASLHCKFPGLTIIGEEEEGGLDSEWVESAESDEVLSQSACMPAFLNDVKEEDICVWVDPLDGTNEYTQGFLDHVTVLIGVAVGGKATAGIIHHPYYNSPGLVQCGCHDDSTSRGQAAKGAVVGRTMWGVVGLGTFGVQSPPTVEDGRRRIVTTKSHETELVKKSNEACEATELIRVGGAGYKVLYMMEGGAEAYLYTNPGTNKWDTCAPDALLCAAGGCFTDVTGASIDYSASAPHFNKGGIVATKSPKEQKWFVAKIPEEVKKALMG